MSRGDTQGSFYVKGAPLITTQIPLITTQTPLIPEFFFLKYYTENVYIIDLRLPVNR